METIFSPGVYNSENDQTFLPPGVPNPGAAVIGPTPKGEAFIPTVVTSYEDYKLKFGASDGNSYVPFVVYNYLKNAESMVVVRTTGLTGYNHINIGALIASSSLGERIVGILHRSTALSSETANTATFVGSTLATDNEYHVVSGSQTQLLELSGSGFDVTQSIALHTNAVDYYGKIYGRAPKTTKVAYLYSLFTAYNSSSFGTAGTASIKLVVTNTMTLSASSGTNYSVATTPWVTSQTVGGIATNLFRFHTRSHGELANESYKVTISNIKKGSEVPGSDYGTFSVYVRDIADTDRVPLILEQFNNVTLDPDATNYIEKVIGTKSAAYSNGVVQNTGDYDNKSDYIRVETTADVNTKSISPDLNPWGFRAVSEPVYIDGFYFPAASMVTNQVYNNGYNDKICYGYNFDFVNTDNKEYLKPIATSATVGLNVDFNLNNYSTHANAPSPYNNVSFATGVTPLSARKFSIPFQGGFSAQDPSLVKYMGADITDQNTMGFNVFETTDEGYQSYDRAIQLLDNKDFYDIGMLFTPGIIKVLHNTLTERIINMVETRNDVFYPFDGSNLTETTFSTVVDNIQSIDSSYAATFYPWLKQFDVDLQKYLWVPGTVGFAEAVSYNDKVGYQWNAPAGLIRGGITSASDVYITLKQADRDVLYQGRVNPIAIFPNEGINVWGQKTLQAKPSALDRINVRRLLVNLKKYFTKMGRRLVFEQNTARTRTNFLNVVNPYMEDVKQKQGLYVFYVQLDEKLNTNDVIDKNMIKGKVFLQPTKVAEFVSFEFNVTKTGATFDI